MKQIKIPNSNFESGVMHKNLELSQGEFANAIGLSVGRTGYAIKALTTRRLLAIKQFRLAFSYGNS